MRAAVRRVPGRRSRPRGRALVLVVALSGTACAGEVGKLRNAAPSQAVRAGPLAARGGAAPETTADTSSGAAISGQAAPTGTPAATTAPLGGPSITATSGPAARLSRSAAGIGGPGPAGGGTGPSGPATSAVPSPAAAGPGPGGPAGSPPGGSAGNTGTGAAPPPPPVPGGSTVGLTPDTITLGFFYPKTGPYAGLLRNMPVVAQAAADEAGLINGRRLVMKYYDDGTANASTIQVEEKRAKDEAFLYFSAVSESNVVLGPLAEQHRVPIIIGNVDQKVAEKLTYGFALVPYWARQATILPSFIKNVLGGGGKKIGIVYETTSTATDAKNAFKEAARPFGLNVVFEQPIAQAQSACANEVSNLQAHGVELVYMMNGPLGAICMLRDAKFLGYHPTWTGVGTSWGFNVVAAASGGGADGIRVLSTSTTLETPQGRHYAELIRKAAPNSGADGDDIMLAVYGAMLSIIEGLRRAGPDLNRQSLVQTWETKMNGYDSGYLPPPTFAPGNRSGPLMVAVGACCTNGQWTTPQPGWRAGF